MFTLTLGVGGGPPPKAERREWDLPLWGGKRNEHGSGYNVSSYSTLSSAQFTAELNKIVNFRCHSRPSTCGRVRSKRSFVSTLGSKGRRRLFKAPKNKISFFEKVKFFCARASGCDDTFHLVFHMRSVRKKWHCESPSQEWFVYIGSNKSLWWSVLSALQNIFTWKNLKFSRSRLLRSRSVCAVFFKQEA